MFEPVKLVPADRTENDGRIDAPTTTGLRFNRLFTAPDRDPLDDVVWEKRVCVIRNDKGEPIFEQHAVEAPVFWSDMAVNVVASRYFRGKLGHPERESNVRRLIMRVVQTIGRWGREQDYFASEEDASAFQDELTALLILQKASFNSPVWFNVGIEETPQCSACFFLSVDDTM